MTQEARVSLVATVLNEAVGIREWLAAIYEQTRQPEEIIVVDGGSTDGTWEALQDAERMSGSWLRAISAPGSNISEGRNLAMDHAIGDIVVVTDAGTRAHPEWLAQLVAELSDPDIDVASGFFAPGLSSAWQRSLAAATLPDPQEIDPEKFLPSSRSMAFRAEWFRNGLRYPEWLDYCEDLVWDLAMRRAGARFRFVPAAVVTFAVRGSPGAYARQYYRYARGDGKAGLFARRHALRYATYAAAFVVLARRRPIENVIAGALGLVYVLPVLRRLARRDHAIQSRWFNFVRSVPLAVALRGLGDLAKMAGYPAGLYWRWRCYGALGWRTSWRRITPSGELWRPESP